MSSPTQDHLSSSFAFPGCDCADCACDLHHEGGLNINNIDFDGAQMVSENILITPSASCLIYHSHSLLLVLQTSCHH